jgi:hypothetical protein
MEFDCDTKRRKISETEVAELEDQFLQLLFETTYIFGMKLVPELDLQNARDSLRRLIYVSSLLSISIAHCRIPSLLSYLM